MTNDLAVGESTDAESPEHVRRVAYLATAWFFCIMLAYGCIRPIRETLGSMGTPDELANLMLLTVAVVTAIVPVYGWLAARLPRRWLVRIVYHFFTACLIVFGSILWVRRGDALPEWLRVTIFVWVNVFALLATSVFWSVLADVFRSEQGKLWFGKIAAGGTVGAILGALSIFVFGGKVPTTLWMLMAATSLQVGLFAAWRIERVGRPFQDSRVAADGATRGTGGGIWSGIVAVFKSPYLIAICGYFALIQAAGTHLYLQQAEIVAAEVTLARRPQLFAGIDFATQMLTLSIQYCLTPWLLRRIGLAAGLVALPAAYFVGFGALATRSNLVVLMVAMVAARAIAYGVTVPSREVLFTSVTREQKYKAKNFIDTVVLRGSDAAAGQGIRALMRLVDRLPVVNVAGSVVCVAWAALGWRLAAMHRRSRREGGEFSGATIS